MRLEKVAIQQYRSIEKITLTFPENKPLVLFGPNNAGKSNILSAIDRLLGERYPTYIEMLDNILVQGLLHLIVIANTYFLLSGEKYYNENVGAE